MKITFLGAAQQVTGSKYLIEYEATKILIDCGLSQGKREVRQQNWDPFPINPSSIDAVVLTHAHIDHAGYVPRLVKQGFKGSVYCSRATYELSFILLKDSGSLQEEDAKRANKYGYSRHTPALPLYTLQDAEYALTFFKTVKYETQFKIGSLTVVLRQAGHILGASIVIVSSGTKTISFSGDLGRPVQPIMKAPEHISQTDYLVLESTYGNRLHGQENADQELANAVNKIVAQKGILIIPAFAVGRTQIILYKLYQLIQDKIIPKIPIYLNSPMAINVTDLYCLFKQEHKLSSQKLCKEVFQVAEYVDTVEGSKSLNNLKGPAIIIAGSGMADGGRVMHHLKSYIGDSKNMVLFVGYQAQGTQGRYLVDGSDQVKVYGEWFQVRAEIRMIHTLSAHADYDEILKWLSFLKSAPQKLFLVHGELDAAQFLQVKIKEKFGWNVVIPKYLESFDLS